jgi:hypothetical protein
MLFKQTISLEKITLGVKYIQVLPAVEIVFAVVLIQYKYPLLERYIVWKEEKTEAPQSEELPS